MSRLRTWNGGTRCREAAKGCRLPALFPPLMAAGIEIDEEVLEELCRRHHIRRLAVFGSVLRGELGPESDLDVLVEFEEGHTPGLGYFEIEEELTELFGRPVDLNTPGFLSRYIRTEVLEEAVDQYAAT